LWRLLSPGSRPVLQSVGCRSSYTGSVRVQKKDSQNRNNFGVNGYFFLLQQHKLCCITCSEICLLPGVSCPKSNIFSGVVSRWWTLSVCL
jgi:hypothetical protein